MWSEEGVCRSYDGEVGWITLGFGGEAEEFGGPPCFMVDGHRQRGSCVDSVLEEARQEAGDLLLSFPSSLKIY